MLIVYLKRLIALFVHLFLYPNGCRFVLKAQNLMKEEGIIDNTINLTLKDVEVSTDAL